MAKSLPLVYFATAIAFLAVDVVGLTQVIVPVFEAQLGDLLREPPDYAAAVVFYFLYIAGIVWFVSAPALRDARGLGWVFGNGALLGLLCYGTYEFTNMATLTPWAWHLVAMDVVWGMALTGTSAAAGVAIMRWITGGR